MRLSILTGGIKIFISLLNTRNVHQPSSLTFLSQLLFLFLSNTSCNSIIAEAVFFFLLVFFQANASYIIPIRLQTLCFVLFATGVRENKSLF